MESTEVYIDAERLVVVPHRIGRRPVSAGILEKCRTFGVEFGKIELHSFVAIVWNVRFIHMHSCIFFRAAGIFQATGMVFRHFIVRHCRVNKLMSVFLCVCPVIYHEFRYNIVKVAVDLRGSADWHPFVFYNNNRPK